MIWVLDHLPDIESDLSRFHRIDDYERMPSARFFKFAERLAAYGGVMTARVAAVTRREEAAPPQPLRQLAPTPRRQGGAEVVELAAAAVMSPDLFERKRVS